MMRWDKHFSVANRYDAEPSMWNQYRSLIVVKLKQKRHYYTFPISVSQQSDISQRDQILNLIGGGTLIYSIIVKY